ncbi:MAG TPA: amidohydrolase family protein [Pseudonocardiaceae bacterium]|nr:amidohydrolase family protein [Pseudonocardiaceae bacterium]
MAAKPIFDFHVHLCRTAADEARVYHRPGWEQDWYWANEARISSYLDLWGVEHIVVLNIMDTRRMRAQRVAAAERAGRTPPSQDELAEGMRDRVHRFNAWLCDLAARDNRVIPFAMGDPVLFGDSVVDEIKAAVAAGARGVKVHPGICGHFPSDPRAMAVYEYCEAEGLPVLTDTSGAVRDGEVYGAPASWHEVLPRFPRLRLVLAHLPGERWDEMLELSAKFDNCWFDMSGGFVDENHPRSGHRDLPFDEAARVIRKIGVERVLFGSDAPAHGREIPDAAAQLLALPLTEDEQDAVLFGNARRFFAS